MEKKLLIDGFETTFREFIHDNTEQEDQIEFEDILRVYNCPIGETIYIGIMPVTVLS